MVYRATRSDTSPETALTPAGHDAALTPEAPQEPFVLLIDDDPVVVGLLERALTAEGYRVGMVVADTLTAESMHDIERPLAVVVDITAPDVGGFGIIQRLAQNQATAGVPVILMSTRSGLKDRRASRQGKNFLIKPFRPSELLLMLKRLRDVAAPE